MLRADHMSNRKAKRRAMPPHARWTTLREESVFSLVHAYRMYLEVATLTEQEECRARNLKNAKRVRGQLRELIPQVHFGPLMRHCVCVGVKEIMSVHPTDQPDAVRAAIGQKGQALQGPLTRRYSGATWVRVLTTFQIGRAANPELDEARHEQVRLSQTRWWRKNCTEICSGGERYAEQRGEPFDRPACFKTCIANPPTVSR